jgi:DNA polymerase (family 10)
VTTAESRWSNAEIADRLMSLAQLLAARKENRFKIKAYRRAAKSLRTLSESLDKLVREEADLTEYTGIGKAIGGAIREIVLTGTLRQLETLRAQVSPEVAAMNEYPRLDPARVLRIFKKLNIASVEELKQSLANGEILRKLGSRMDAHVRQALTDSHEMLLYDAEPLVVAIEDFLMNRCGVRRVEATGAYRRRVEVLGEVSFLIETDDFPAVVAKLDQYGGGTERLSVSEHNAVLQLPAGIRLNVQTADAKKWGLGLICSTGAAKHLRKLEQTGTRLRDLARSAESFPDEAAVYGNLGLTFIEPELREGGDEVERAARGTLPELVTIRDIRGELHAHTTSSDGSNTIEQMARAAHEKGYEYIGITDHSRSLKIAGGLSEEDLWKQIRYIDKLTRKRAEYGF